MKPGMVLHTFNTSTPEAKAQQNSVSLRRAWYTKYVPGDRETLPQKQTEEEKGGAE